MSPKIAPTRGNMVKSASSMKLAVDITVSESHCSDSDGAISPAELSRPSGEGATLSGKRRFVSTRQPPGPSSFS